MRAGRAARACQAASGREPFVQPGAAGGVDAVQVDREYARHVAFAVELEVAGDEPCAASGHFTDQDGLALAVHFETGTASRVARGAHDPGAGTRRIGPYHGPEGEACFDRVEGLPHGRTRAQPVRLDRAVRIET